MSFLKSIISALTLALLCASIYAQSSGPRLIQQRPDGETNPECCVVALSVRNFYPILHVGTPLPVGPLTFNYVGVQATGIPDETPVTVILDRGGEHYEVPAIAYPMPGWPGVTNVLWFAPSCANGEYRLSIRNGEQVSPVLLIRFTSDCHIDVARPARAGQL